MKRSLAMLLAAAVLLAGSTLRAQTDDPPAELANKAVASLRAGHPAEAVADLESLADRGVVDANVSFDRGLAYAERIRAGGEQPGDLGLAIHGFEEARFLTRDSTTKADATRALAILRAEVGRRRASAGHPVDLEQTPRLRDAIVGALSEDVWCALALLLSVTLGAALFVRWLSRERRRQVAANVVVAISVPLGMGATLATYAARDIRLHRIEAIVVTAAARPSNDAGIALPDIEPLPEGARVQLLAENAGWDEIRWGSLDAWIPAAAIRAIARPATE